MSIIQRTLAGGAFVAALGTPVAAQSLADRVAAAPAGHVEFTFAARPGICGNGRTFYSTGPGNINGSYYGGDFGRAERCDAGPVRVLLDRADRQVIAVQAFVGPVHRTDGATHLGAVPAQQAADFLLGLASRAEGRVGSQALSSALLADSARLTDGLSAVARNQQLPRATRTAAIRGLARTADDAASGRVADLLVGLVRDDGDNQEVRREAVRTLASLPHGAGVPTVTSLASQRQSAWIAREAMQALAGSGDPRARAYIRSAVQDDAVPSEVLAIAIRALGGSYATPQDAALLRSLYPRLATEATRSAVLSTVASVGGRENAEWLLARARDESEDRGRRTSALSHAVTAGARIGELVAMYDGVTDPSVKTALVGIYLRNGERAAIDKLLSIVRLETNVSVRRSAISQLSRSEDPRVKAALKDLVER